MNQGLRAITNNRKIIPPNYREYLVGKSGTESEYFTISPISLKVDDKEKKNENENVQNTEEVEVIHVKNLQEYVDHAISERGYSNNRTLVKILGDTGGEFFKISMSISNDFKDNGVNKLLLIAICTKSKEDYEMVSQVFNLLDLNITGSQLIVTGENINFIL